MLKDKNTKRKMKKIKVIINIYKGNLYLNIFYLYKINN